MDLEKSAFAIFPERGIDPAALVKYRRQLAKHSVYLICMTPRSGSSFLADLLRQTGSLGQPGEFFNHKLARQSLNAIARRRGELRNLVDYMAWLLRARSTRNRVFGVKASYFQLAPFIEAGLDGTLLGKPLLFVLRRRNLVKQAISLFIATRTQHFHSVQRTQASNAAPEYDAQELRRWILHIHAQEQGWDKYLAGREVAHVLEYDALSSDPAAALGQFASRLAPGVALPPAASSGHRKIGDQRNEEYFQRFVQAGANRRYLEDELGIGEERLSGL